MQFFNPALLAGAALFAVPLIIHLLNRQRHKRRDWAAMEFLLRAFRKQRRRLRRENLLLLLLRCLIPILLALAVARPVLQRASLIGAGGGTVHHVVVLDSSYSMGYHQDGGTSPFEKGRTLIGRLLDRLEQNADQNPKVTLVSAGVHPRFLVRNDLNLQTARSQWLQLQKPEDAAGELTEAMVQVAGMIEAGNDPQTVVYVLTDLQTRAFGKALQPPSTAAAPTEPEFKDTLRDICERLQARQDVQLHLIDVGPFADAKAGGQADNVQIVDLHSADPAVVVNVANTIVVRLRNRGQVSVNAELTLEVDGQSPTRKLVELEPGAEGEAEFQVVFRDIGRHRLRAGLLGDGLEADDERFLAVEVRDRIRVLVVDGDAGGDPLQAATYVWQMILDPSHGEGPPDITRFDVVPCDTLALLTGQRSPQQFDVTVLANVDRLNERAAGEIGQALRAGKGVLFALGNRVDATSYNLHLGSGASTEAIMPFQLLRPAGADPGAGVERTLVVQAPEHPVFAEFEEDVYKEVLQAVPVYHWYGVAKDSVQEPAQVLATLTDPEQSPLLVARTAGEGRVLFWLSGPASEYRPERWNRFDDPIPAFFLMHGIVKWLALPASDPFRVEVGSQLCCSVAGRPENPEVVLPERDGGQKVPVSDEPRPLLSGRYMLPAFVQTLHAGFYTYELTLERDTGQEHLSLPFAVNVDPAEGELRYAAHADLGEAIGVQRVLTGLPTDANAGAAPESSEFGPMLLLALLLFVLGEAAMARYVSVRRG